jgi:hypothetical protein
MTPQRRNATLVLALLCAIASIPLPWVTHRKTQVQMIGTVTDRQTGRILSQPVTYTFTHVTGLNGFLQFGITVPFWLVSSMLCVSCVCQLLGGFAILAFCDATAFTRICASRG